MMPSMPDEDNHQGLWRRHHSYGWAPPKSSQNSRRPNDSQPGVTRFNGDSSAESSNDHFRNTPITSKHRVSFPLVQAGTPLVANTILRHNNSPIGSALLSTKRSGRNPCHNRRRAATLAFVSRRKYARGFSSNKICVRIKRVTKEKDPSSRPKHIDYRVRFNPLNHSRHHHDDSNNTTLPSSSTGGWENQCRNTGRQFDERKLQDFKRKDSLPKEKITMTQKLLDLDEGPISWNCIDYSRRPPDAFVRYLASVLTDEVQFYLKQNPGKEFWIKHVGFWSDLLHPENRSWKKNEGSSYREISEKLYNNLRRRWGGSSFIECDSENRGQNLFVRACILFARKPTMVRAGAYIDREPEDGSTTHPRERLTRGIFGSEAQLPTEPSL